MDRGSASGRRAFAAPLVGGVGAFVVFLFVLLNGHASVLQSNPLSGFYDLQAHSLLRGSWNVPAAPVGVEGIRLHGQTFIYFGPFPALLRIPIALFTSRFDGRLTQLSMLVAFITALVFTTTLTLRIRDLRRPGTSPTRAERIAVGAFVFLVGAGSVLLFLASHAVVYHEAEIWGAALAIGALDGLVAFLVRPSAGRLVAISVLCASALLARVSVGLGPVIGLVLIGGFSCLGRSSVHVGIPAVLTSRRWRAAIACAALSPLLIAAGVNLAKFDNVANVPFDHQVFTRINPTRRAALRANGGSAFGMQFVPTTAWQYARPDALRFNNLFPWLGFPGQPTVVGDVHFDRGQPSASLTATMPALAVLALIGAATSVRRHREEANRTRALRLPLAGAFLATFATLAILQVAQRYVSDFLPVLVLAAAAGLVEVGTWLRASRRGHVVRSGAVVIIVILGLGSVWANFGLGELAQHELGADVTDRALAGFVALQYRVHRVVPGGPPPDVRRGSAPPRRSPAATVFVAGRCDAVYWSNGIAWRALTRTHAAGLANMRVTFPAGASPKWEPLLSSGPPNQYQVLGVLRLPGDRVRFGLALGGKTYGFSAGKPVSLGGRRVHDVTAVLDPRIGEASISLDHRRVFSLTSTFELGDRVPPRVLASGGTPEVGTTTVGFAAPRFSGSITLLPAPGRSICDVLAPASRARAH